MPAVPPSADPPPLPDAAVRSVIVGLMLAILLGALDQTIVAVSLPSITGQLRGFELVAWIVSGYLVAATVITPIYGKLADLYGARTLLSFAIVVFVIASVACALAQSMPQLIAARILQGLGAGGLISLAQAIIPQVVSMRERGRYQGYLSGVFAFASVAGPVVGGLITQYLSWRWVFWINIPLGAAALIISRRALAQLPVPGRRPHIDYLGAVLLTLGLALLLIAITRIGQGVSWREPTNLGLLGVALVTLAICLWHERSAREPMLPLALFKMPVVALSSGIMFLAFFQLIALAALMPLRFDMVTGVGADTAGLRLVPLTLGIPAGAFAAGKLMTLTGRYKHLQLVGAALVPPAVLALALTDAHAALWIALFMATAGFAIGLQIPTSLVATQNAVPAHNIGIATASLAFFRSLGGAIGVAVLSAVLFATLGEQMSALVGALPGGETIRDMLTQAATADSANRQQLLGAAEGAFRQMLCIGAAISTISIALALFVPEQPLRGRVSVTS